MNKITILMATLNGERYLREQLDSLLAQTCKDWELYIRDDGSTDNTIDIIRSVLQQDRRLHLVSSAGSVGGACRNYAVLLEQAAGPYVMFCDQDDVWLSDKIEVTLSTMKDCERQFGADTPILVHTDCRVVDSACREISPSFMAYQHMEHVEDNPLRILLSQNFITGCTVMANHALLSISRPVPDNALMHDWWLGLMAAATGKIAFVPRGTLLYRQHTDNAVGASRLLSGHHFRRLFKFADLNAAMSGLMLQNCALLKHLKGLTGGPHTPEVLDDLVAAARKGRRSALASVLKNRIAKQGLLRNLLFFFLLSTGSYPSALRSASL